MQSPNVKPRAVIHVYADSFEDLISVAYAMIAFSMNKKEGEITLHIRETEYAHVIEIEGSYLFTKNALEVLLGDKKMVKYHYDNGLYRIFSPKYQCR